MEQGASGLEGSSPHPSLERILEMLAELPERYSHGFFRGGDPEQVHIAADGLLLEALRQLEGGGKVADAYEALKVQMGGFWYA